MFEMMLYRMNSNINTEPARSSIWIFAKWHYPNYWDLMRKSTIVIILLIFLYKYGLKKLHIPILSMLSLILFVDVLLLAGSIDRMNIGVMVSILLFFWVDSSYAKFLSWYYIVGTVTLVIIFLWYRHLDITEIYEAIFAMIYVVLFCSYPIYEYFGLNKKCAFFSKGKK